MKFKVQLSDGSKYSKYIGEGILDNPNQEVEVTSNIEPIAGASTLVAVYPVEDTNICWTDAHGEKHTDRLYANNPIAIPSKFIVRD